MLLRRILIQVIWSNITIISLMEPVLLGVLQDPFQTASLLALQTILLVSQLMLLPQLTLTLNYVSKPAPFLLVPMGTILLGTAFVNAQ